MAKKKNDKPTQPATALMGFVHFGTAYSAGDDVSGLPGGVLRTLRSSGFVGEFSDEELRAPFETEPVESDREAGEIRPAGTGSEPPAGLSDLHVAHQSALAAVGIETASEAAAYYAAVGGFEGVDGISAGGSDKIAAALGLPE